MEKIGPTKKEIEYHLSKGNDLLKVYRDDESVIDVAKYLIEKGNSLKNPNYAIIAAKMYEKIGYSNEAINSANRSARIQSMTKKIDPELLKECNAIILRNRKSGLEKRVVVIISFISILIGIFMSSTNMTGKIISDISQKTSETLGLVFILIGFIDLIIYKKIS